ncbi:hypothetical protein J2X98_004040, partial [Pseudarthrobacter enclensis]|nr:hypothetical protein [Pseudarthrobacter enclensis]
TGRSRPRASQDRRRQLNAPGSTTLVPHQRHATAPARGQSPHSHERNGKPGAPLRATPVPYWYHTKATPVRRQPAAKARTATRETGSQARACLATPVPYWYHTVLGLGPPPIPKPAAQLNATPVPHWHHASVVPTQPYHTGITLVRAGPPSRPVLKLREEQRLVSPGPRTTLVSGRYHTSMEKAETTGIPGTAPRRR